MSINVYKPQKPIEQQGKYVYPKTVASQVRMDDENALPIKDYIDGEVGKVDDKIADSVKKSDLLTLEQIEAGSPEQLAGKGAAAESVRELSDQLVKKIDGFILNANEFSVTDELFNNQNTHKIVIMTRNGTSEGYLGIIQHNVLIAAFCLGKRLM